MHSARRPIRSRNSRWATAIAGTLARRGIRPNTISVASVLFAAVAGLCLWTAGRVDRAYTPWQSAGMSLVITLMGFAGGLVMSAIKRDRGVKDYGSLIEGHGGVMDRIDSICFSAPVFFHLTRCFFTL